MNSTATPLQTKIDQTGLRWNMPNSEYCVIWAGPGTSLILTKKAPGGRLTAIDFDSKSKTFPSHEEAQAGFDFFLARTEARRNAQPPAFVEHSIRHKRK